MSRPHETVDRALWRDAGIGVAYLDRQGVVERANPYLEERAQRRLRGVPFIACVAPEQHVAFHDALADLGDGSRQLLLGLFPDARDVPRDHRLSLRGEGARVLVVAVPAAIGQEALLERLLRYNAELLRARRGVGAARPADTAARALRHCRAITDPALAALAGHQLVAEVLARLVEALDATGALLLERRPEDGPGALAPVHSHGLDTGAAPLPVPGTMAARLALPSSAHIVRDALSIRLLSPAVGRTGARCLGLVPLWHDGQLVGALHVGGRTPDALDADDVVVWSAASRLGPAVATVTSSGKDGNALAPHCGAAAALPGSDAREAATCSVVLDRPGGGAAREAILRLAGFPAGAARIAAELLEAVLAAPPFVPGAGAGQVLVSVTRSRDGVRVRLESRDETHVRGDALNRVRGAARAWGFERDRGTRLWFEV